jgi:hypothetical protein
MAYMAIETKFFGATNHRGERIKATAMDTFSDGKSISLTLPYDSELNAEDNHTAAALKLVLRVTWYNPDTDTVNLYHGATKRGYVFVIVKP